MHLRIRLLTTTIASAIVGASILVSIVLADQGWAEDSSYHNGCYYSIYGWYDTDGGPQGYAGASAFACLTVDYLAVSADFWDYQTSQYYFVTSGWVATNYIQIFNTMFPTDWLWAYGQIREPASSYSPTLQVFPQAP